MQSTILLRRASIFSMLEECRVQDVRMSDAVVLEAELMGAQTATGPPALARMLAESWALRLLKYIRHALAITSIHWYDSAIIRTELRAVDRAYDVSLGR